LKHCHNVTELFLNDVPPCPNTGVHAVILPEVRKIFIWDALIYATNTQYN